MNCSYTDNGRGDAVDLKTIVGFTTTLPPLAQHEHVDTRATHYQKVQLALHSPQYALDSKHGSYHTEPQTPVHAHTCMNNNTATRTNCCPKMQLGISPHMPPCHTKQSTCMFWLGANDSRCQSFAKPIYQMVKAIMHNVTCENKEHIRMTSPKHIYASLVTAYFSHNRVTLAASFLRPMHLRLFNKCQLRLSVVNWLTSHIICRLLLPWSHLFVLVVTLPPTCEMPKTVFKPHPPDTSMPHWRQFTFLIIELRLLICFFSPCISGYLTHTNCLSLLSTGSCCFLGHTFFLGFLLSPLPDDLGVFFRHDV